MIGKGKYDDACTAARDATGAQGALLIVFAGREGNGFSAQLPENLVCEIPELLRYIADQIEADAKKLQEEKSS